MPLTTTSPFTAADCDRNLRWFLVIRFSYDFMLWGPVWVLYMTQTLGLSFTQIMLLEMAFQTLMILMEIPTGMFADTHGRVWALRGSAIAFALTIGLWGTAQNAAWVMGAWFFWALAETLWNGTDAALLYESLLAAGRESRFARTLGRIGSITVAGAAVAAIIGGWAAQWGFRPLMWAHAVLILVGVFAAFRLREPPRADDVVPGSPRQIIRGMWTLLTSSAKLRVLLLAAATIDVVYVVVIIFQQPLMLEAGFDIAEFGPVYAVSTILAAAGPITLTWLSSRWGVPKTLLFIGASVTCLCLVTFMTPGLWIVVPLTLLRPFGHGARPVAVEGMNALVQGHGRATVLSLRGIASAALVGPTEVLTGIWADRYPIRKLFLALTGALPPIMATLTVIWRRSSQDRGIAPRTNARDTTTDSQEG